MKKQNSKESEIEKLKPKIIEILRKKGIKKAGIFGSYARGEQKEGSDIDILIEPVEGMGLKFVGLNLELEKELGIKVDLISYNGINTHLKKYILSDEIRII
ncbi:nucleotidyltransferase family protein [Candidatus Pacearchaeota archaeon]|nr:nucleotidyltransferase family protein [Candidatus Pacearchaeota archaeon]